MRWGRCPRLSVRATSTCEMETVPRQRTLHGAWPESKNENQFRGTWKAKLERKKNQPIRLVPVSNLRSCHPSTMPGSSRPSQQLHSGTGPSNVSPVPDWRWIRWWSSPSWPDSLHRPQRVRRPWPQSPSAAPHCPPPISCPPEPRSDRRKLVIADGTKLSIDNISVHGSRSGLLKCIC